MTLRALVYALLAPVVFAAAQAQAQAPTYQGALPAEIVGPRKVATTAEGEPFVVDAGGRMHRLTRRGELVAEVLRGVAAVAAAPGAVFAALKDGSLVQVNPRTGRVVRRTALGTSEVPAGLAYDAARARLWVAFESGSLQARGLDGRVLHQLAPGAGGSYRLTGVAVDPAGTVWVMQDRTGAGGTMHAYDASTGALVRSVPVAVRIAGGISVDGGGRVFVSDAFAGKVQVVDAKGAAAGSVGSYGSGAGQLNQPAAVSFLPNGDLVVANMNANRLDRFGAGAALPACPGDADCDGLPDAWEAANGLAGRSAANALADLDRDGLNDSEEYALGSNPRSADTDGDGFGDGEEVANGFDPRDAHDHEPQVLAANPGPTGPGLVRLKATVRDPVGTRGACSAQWRQVSGPPVVLKGASTTAPSFVARQAATYALEAVGTCGGVRGPAKRVEVAVSNVPPRVDGGRVTTLAAGRPLRLSGEFSRDANGDALSFQWDQVVGAPVAGTVQGETLTASVEQPGYYVFRLGATDPAGAEGAAEVPVIVLGDAPAPTAVAASPVVAEVGEVATLDASASYRGEAATFAWRQVEGPAVELAGADAAAAIFVPPAPGRYAFEVDVAEAGMRSPSARVEVYAAAAGATPPVASAAAPATAAVGAAVALDGSASLSGSGALAYAWRQVSGPAAGLTRADRATATAVLFEAGTYEFELSVKEGDAVGLPARVQVEARTAARSNPVAVATAAGTASVGELVLLDGRASTGAVRHRWAQVEGPWVTIEQGELGAFRPLAPGAYAFELEVDDGAVRSAPARVNVVVFQNGTENSR